MKFMAKTVNSWWKVLFHLVIITILVVGFVFTLTADKSGSTGYIIAAPDTPDIIKAGAHIVADDDATDEIMHAIEKGYMPIILTQGTFHANITCNTSLKLVGSGKGATLYMGSIRIYGSGDIYPQNERSVEISDITINGTGNIGISVEINSGSLKNFRVKNTKFTDCSIGIELVKTLGFTDISNCEFFFNDTGISMHPDVHVTSIDNCDFESNEDYGIKAVGARQTSLRNTNVFRTQNKEFAGVYFEDSHDIFISGGCSFGNNNGSGVWITNINTPPVGEETRFDISNSWFNQNAVAGLRMSNRHMGKVDAIFRRNHRGVVAENCSNLYITGLYEYNGFGTSDTRPAIGLYDSSNNTVMGAIISSSYPGYSSHTRGIVEYGKSDWNDFIYNNLSQSATITMIGTHSRIID